MSEDDSRLYRKLLGDAWMRLSAVVRAAHRPETNIPAVFTIRLGNWLARLMARLSGLPPAGDDVQTRLRIESTDGAEKWQREFNGHPFSTRQWASKDGLLVEYFNGWELAFALAEENGALVYQQRRAHLCLGRVRIPTPLVLAPRVYAREQGSGQGRTAVEVRVVLPLIGTLIVYTGELYTGEEADQ